MATSGKAPCTGLPREARSPGSVSFLISKTERKDLTALIIRAVWDFPHLVMILNLSRTLFFITQSSQELRTKPALNAALRGNRWIYSHAPQPRAYLQKGRIVSVQKVPVVQLDRFQVLPYDLGDRDRDSVTAVFIGAGLYGGSGP